MTEKSPQKRAGEGLERMVADLDDPMERHMLTQENTEAFQSLSKAWTPVQTQDHRNMWMNAAGDVYEFGGPGPTGEFTLIRPPEKHKK